MKKYLKNIKQCAYNSGITMESGNINNVCNQFAKDFKKLVTPNKEILKMKLCRVKIIFCVLSLTTLVGSNVLSAQDILRSGEKSGVKIRKNNLFAPSNALMQSYIYTVNRYEIGDKYMHNVTDTMRQELYYNHNFQSGIPALDNYLDIKILNGTGKKMKKNEMRSILADVPEALNKYNSGTRLYTTAALLGVASIGILAVRLSKPDNKYLWMTVGIGCSTGVVICRLVGTSKLKSAINTYNGAKVNCRTSDLSLNLEVPHSGGLGLTLTF
jgi:hypothetical protein